MSITGKWNLVIQAPTGAMESVMELVEEAGALSGTLSGKGGDNEIKDGKIAGSEVSWISHISQPMKMKLEFAGTVEGKAMTGKVKAGFMGSYPFTATQE